mmetsp:Transcript_8532/g.16185  ORF Transcript_8532/g.16185 Transcript_8532/m.16185 type:complete len:432 (+) Transcript_8532:35-1330(+)
MVGREISAAEAAIEAWASCKPKGYILEEHRLPELLPLIALKVPNTSPELYDRMHQELFTGKTGSAPIFSALLQPCRGKVHFLSFWKAFGKAVHMAADTPQGVLLSELETLRDRVLYILEKGSPGQVSGTNGEHVISQEAAISISALEEEVHRAAAMSAQPSFWREAAALLSRHLEVPELHIEELSSLILLWLNECVRWEQVEIPAGKHQESKTQCFNPFKEACGIAAYFGSLAADLHSAGPISMALHPAPRVGQVVRIHVYDVTQRESIQKLNQVLAHTCSPLKFGGVFHAGVEVNDLEWSFAYQPHHTRYGVECNYPKMHPLHHFRQTVAMGATKCSAEDVTKIIAQMVEEYPGDDYDLLRRNCCHFADDFCQRLGVGNIPPWVYRLARIGAGVAEMLEAAQVTDQLQNPKYVPKLDTLRILGDAEFEIE